MNVFSVSVYMANFISSLCSNKALTHICPTWASPCTGTMQHLVTSTVHGSAHGPMSTKWNPGNGSFKNSTDWYFAFENLKKQSHFYAPPNAYLLHSVALSLIHL